ncbi:MAG: SUMF1/EgtB/PvdO family nonheme iron enzyme [Terriglobia bacterium]
MPLSRNPVEEHQNLIARLAAARQQTDRLFEIVRPEFLYERPIPERHRIIFYLGHLEAFDWNLLRDRFPGLQPFDKESDKLFAFGIDPVGGGLPADRPADWPRISQVRQYNDRVRHALEKSLEAAKSSQTAPDSAFSTSVLLNVAIEHRLMHAETLAYMFHQLPLAQKVPQAAAPAEENRPVKPGMVEIPGGSATLGLVRDGDSAAFGWDNEYEAHSVHVKSFEIDRYKVTNGEYLRFMSAGGYDDPSYWTAEDWKWTAQSGVTHPVFWKRSGDAWFYRGMFHEFPLPLNWPVYVSHAEAGAYARWAGKTLPSEAQWHRAAYPNAESGPEAQDGEAPRLPRGNFDFKRWEPAPVNSSDDRSAWGVEDMLGNGWEWTSTRFEPFQGFQPFPFYPGYSANFFDGKHFVMKGGSARTAACMMRRSFRNWFQPYYQYVYAGFRCVSA